MTYGFAAGKKCLGSGKKLNTPVNALHKGPSSPVHATPRTFPVVQLLPERPFKPYRPVQVPVCGWQPLGKEHVAKLLFIGGQVHAVTVANVDLYGVELAYIQSNSQLKKNKN